MAIQNATIQHRRGALKDFDAAKMLPGEFAVTTDGSRKVLAAFAAGDVKELASKEEVNQAIAEGIASIEEKEHEALKNIGTGVDISLTEYGKAADAGATGKAIDELKTEISDLKYNLIEITVFSNNIGTAEMGSTVNNVTLSWKTNKTPAALALDGTSVDVSATSKALAGLGLTTNKTWTLVATDERDATSQKTTALNFYNGIYYGVALEASYDSAFILVLTKVLSGTKARTFAVNAGENQYIYYCLPSRLGTPSFNVGGFDGGFTKVTTINFTNSSGYTESYDIWKSDNANLGSTTVKVS